MNINLQLKIKMKKKKDIHQASKYLRTNLKLLNLTTSNLKQAKTFYIETKESSTKINRSDFHDIEKRTQCGSIQ